MPEMPHRTQLRHTRILADEGSLPVTQLLSVKLRNI